MSHDGLYERAFSSDPKVEKRDFLKPGWPTVDGGKPFKVEEAKEGVRFDSGKPRVDLLPADALLELAKVYTDGAVKYAPRNWEKGMNYGRVLGSLLRHTFAWMTGEDRDKETGHLHMAHVAWNALALVTYQLRGMEQFDDRKND